MKKFFLQIILFYQKYFSFDYGFLGKVFPNTRICRFSPTCSAFFYEAVSLHGVLRGSFMGFKRVLRCNSFFTPVAGTYDPVLLSEKKNPKKEKRKKRNLI